MYYIVKKDKTKIKCFVMVNSPPPNPSDAVFTPSSPSEKSAPDFDEFLSLLGDRITLKGWKDYTGGLDAKSMYRLPSPPPPVPFYRLNSLISLFS